VCWLAGIGCQILFPHARALLPLIDDLKTADKPHPGLLVGGQIVNTGAIQLLRCVLTRSKSSRSPFFFDYTKSEKMSEMSECMI
jgi:hypothetical protein